MNRRHKDFQSSALPTELPSQTIANKGLHCSQTSSPSPMAYRNLIRKEHFSVQKTTGDRMAVATTSPKTKEQPQHVSPDGLWRSFPKVPCLMQYVPSGVFFARVRHKGKLFRQSMETDVFTTAKLRLPDRLKELRKPKAEVGTFLP